jgi:hypothetical protein
MIKGWLSQIVSRLNNLCPAECKAIDFPVAVEVAGSENTGWVLFLQPGKVANRAKEEVRVTFFVPQDKLRALSMNLRFKVWKEAFEAGTIQANSEDASQWKKLQSLAEALRKKEA